MMYELKDLLNEEQILPVQDTEGQVLVLAGAGSGKTRVLTYRIANLIQKGVSPYNILAITFTNKAAREMQQRIEQVAVASGLWVSTFHSFCSRILRYDIDKLGYNKNFTIYTDSDSDKVVARILKAMQIEEKTFKQTVRWHISNAKNCAKNPTQYAQILDNERADLIIEVYNRYEEELLKSNALDFDDLLVLAIKLFLKCPEVLQKYQERFKYIHIDEFQDTNKIQYLLVNLLGKKYGNIFIVGDDDQSIYGWRGADADNLMKFKKDFPNCKLYKLQRNYRSTANILDCANKVIANNLTRMGKTLITNAQAGVKVEYKNTYDERAEADFVLSEIDGLIKYNGYKASDFAILTRVNSLTRIFEDKLNMYGMPYKIYGGFKFYERKEIKDVLAYLRVISNPKDKESLLRIINFPKRAIGDTAVEKLLDYCKFANEDLIDAILNIEQNAVLGSGIINKIAVFKNLLVKLINANTNMSFKDFVPYMVEEINFETEYDKDKSDDLNKLENIDEFISAVTEYCKLNPEASLDEYLQNISLSSDTDEEAKDCILMATIHAVKGLEFKCVFIIGLEEGIFPSSRAKDSLSDLEEERRVMYVAITRAKERLFFTNTNSRFRFGKRECNFASRFIKEAGLMPEVAPVMEYSAERKPIDFGKSIEMLLNNVSTKRESANQKDISKFLPNTVIMHKRYGEGIILSVDGENATIKFEKLGVKEFNLRLAPIEVK
ncbi:MAG: UvrD-helicase domain-containing protein [Clostridia bacterium]